METRKLPLGILLFILFSLPVLTAGCGNGGKRLGTVSMLTTGVSIEPNNFGIEGDYTCSLSPDVQPLPGGDPNLDGSGYYRVCVNHANNSQLKIHGMIPNGENAICVFPVQEVFDQTTGRTQVYAKPDPAQNGYPMFQCASISNPVVAFANTNFNAVFITIPEGRIQLGDALLNHDSTKIPAETSYGRFR